MAFWAAKVARACKLYAYERCAVKAAVAAVPSGTIAGAEQALESQAGKVSSEVTREVAHCDVVTVAQHQLASKVVLVMDKLALDVAQLSVELVLLGLLGLV